ncbi:MAG: cytochrome c oxidase subunit II [Acidimicrobiales bacterium]
MTTPSHRWRRVRGIVALPLAALALAGCTVPSFGAKAGATKTAHSTFRLWQGFSIGAVVIGGLVIVLILWAVLAYRRRGDEIPAQSQYHIPLEMIYTVVPIIIVFGLFVATVVVENQVVANPSSPVTIDVNAFQWGWKFTYPGTDAVVVGQTTQNPTMVMPVNTDVHINLTSTDVLHGFYVQAFNFSRYALPGVKNQFTLYATQLGTFPGQCTQLCGLYHSLMFFRVQVVTPAQYRSFIASFTNAAAAAAAAKATGQQTSSRTPSKPTASSGAQ